MRRYEKCAVECVGTCYTLSVEGLIGCEVYHTVQLEFEEFVYVALANNVNDRCDARYLFRIRIITFNYVVRNYYYIWY